MANIDANAIAGVKIFVDRHDQPLRFFVRGESTEADAICENIMKHGGAVVQDADDAIVICANPDPRDDICYSWDFISDCIQQGCLVDINNYKYTSAHPSLAQVDEILGCENEIPTTCKAPSQTGDEDVDCIQAQDNPQDIENHQSHQNKSQPDFIAPSLTEDPDYHSISGEDEPLAKAPRLLPKAVTAKSPFTKEQDRIILEHFAKNRGLALNVIAKQLSDTCEILRPHPQRSIVNRYRKLAKTSEEEVVDPLVVVEENIDSYPISTAPKANEAGPSEQLCIFEEPTARPIEPQHVEQPTNLAPEEPYLAGEIAALVNNLSEDYKVPIPVVYHALFIFSGNVNLATIYLRHGKVPGLEPWTPDEDKEISKPGGIEMEQSYRHRGEPATRDRRAFVSPIFTFREYNQPSKS
eukprot:TRINITY_DN3709_c0_g1_i3.p1 TRINITY_DN3709_c0_g1~~TRINITY_DN3709_c0_g1_i3.p1  ORF type:complete len:410 (+),score=71.27 TRINITY_DN3709_c0_g1_i3:48-1277(+)